MELLPEYQGLPLEDQLAIMRRKALDGTLTVEEMLCATQVRGYGADTARTEQQKG